MKFSTLPLRRLGMMAAAIAGLIAATGCADKRGGPIAYDSANFGVPDAPKVVALGDDYKIAPADTLAIKVFKMPELSGDYDVDLTGQIAMPLIGNVAAADLTTAQLDDRLKEKFGSRYLEHPDISVGVKASSRRSVTIDGAVSKPGTFPVTGTLSLMQAVALGGGATPESNIHRVAIFRTIDDKRQAAAFDLGMIRRGQAQDPPVYPGDIIIIDGSAIKAAQKQILTALPILSIFKPF